MLMLALGAGWRTWLVLIAFVVSSSLCHADQALLQMDDVSRIMKQILEQHAEQKEMSASILRKSFKVYIDQFDPNRMYLLDEEVKPYFNLTDEQVQNILANYKKGNFSQYEKLNDIFQKAIVRSREMRAPMEGEYLSHLFQKSDRVPSDGNGEWSDPDLKRPFAKTVNELTARVRQEIVKFIANERHRYGDAYVAGRQAQTIRIFERQTRAHEDQYMYESENGQQMSEAERQNAFVMHVLKALASALDAHTTVLNPSEAYDMRLRLEKEMQGVGIVLRRLNGAYVVTQMIKDGPAARSGLVHVDDRLIEIDGNQVSKMPLEQVMELLRGKKGTKVVLMLKHSVDDQGNPVEKTTNVTLTREDIALNEDRAKSSFVSTDEGNIGIIKLDSFYQGDNGITSENDVRDAIKKLDQHGNLRGLILDLRENSGGFLSQAVKVAGLFITNGVIVVSKYFNGEEHFYRDMDGKVSYEGPLVVLTSKATASAAEIVAQALQDYGVAVVVGDERTYGKGTIQSQTVTENQASTFFKVTVGKYYTVSGKTPQIQGVKADVVVPSQFLHDNIGEKYLDNPLKHDVISASYNDNLADIAPNLKPWYMRYYAPTLQHKKLFWDEMIPQLKKNSSERLGQNREYQQFIKLGSAPRGRSAEDMQLSETVYIVKDMIALQADRRGNESDLQGSSAQTAGIIRDKK